MTTEDLKNERYLRARAIEQVMASILRPGAVASPNPPDPIAWAHRIVEFVKGDGAAAKSEGGA